MGPSKSNGPFAFGLGACLSIEIGPNQSPFLFSSLASLAINPKTMEIEPKASILRGSRNGGNKQVDDLLPGKSYTSWKRDNPMDKTISK